MLFLLLGGFYLINSLITQKTTQYDYYNFDKNKDAEVKLGKLFVDGATAQRSKFWGNNFNLKNGESYGIGFAIRNLFDSQYLTYEFNVKDDDLNKKCGVGVDEVSSWVISGVKGSTSINKNEIYFNTLRFEIPSKNVMFDDCELYFELVVKEEGGSIYTTDQFKIVFNEPDILVK